MLEKTWVKRQAIPPSSPRLHSPHGLSLLTLLASLFFLTQRSVHPPYGLLIHAQRVRLFPLTHRKESSCRNRVCLSRVFFCWVRAFPHTQTVEVDFPMREPCSLFSFWGGCLPYVLLAVVSNFVLDHCVFVVSHFLLGSAVEFPWLC